MTNNTDDDGWVFDTVKPGTIVSHNTQKRAKSFTFIDDEIDESAEHMAKLDIGATPPSQKPVANSTVRRTSTPIDQSPSVRRSTRKRKSSGMKQPLGVDMTFGNSPSTVRQFRRVSDRQQSPTIDCAGAPSKTDENCAPTTLFSEASTKEAILGRRMYSVGIGLSCQEVLSNTCDQEKREAISRLAEAWSDLEMADPEGLYHIIKSSYEKFQG